MAKQTYIVKGYDRDTGEKALRSVAADSEAEAIKESGIVVESVSLVKSSEDGDSSIPDTHAREDKNISIRLGLGSKREKRKYERPSRKLIYALVVAWLGITVLSYIVGHGVGVSITENNNAAVEYQRERDQLAAEAKRERDWIAFSRHQAALKRISLASGSKARDVMEYLGTPDKVTQVRDSRYPAANRFLPCWVYGEVKIYFDGDESYNTITHWEGDLNGLLDRKLGR